MAIVPRKRRRLLAPGQQFGSFTVLQEVLPHVSPNGKRRPRYECRCVCGRVLPVLMQNLLNGQSTSCGCLRAEKQRRAVTKHGDSRTVLYKAWRAMRVRCERSTDPSFKHYGGRGITVCPEWQDWLTFKAWALANGYRADLEIERIDNNGNYEPGNCRWATRKEQCRNTRHSRMIIAFGETRCLEAWAEDPRCTIHKASLAGRLNRGWDPERAISTPSRGCGRKPKR